MTDVAGNQIRRNRHVAKRADDNTLNKYGNFLANHSGIEVCNIVRLLPSRASGFFRVSPQTAAGRILELLT